MGPFLYPLTGKRRDKPPSSWGRVSLFRGSGVFPSDLTLNSGAVVYDKDRCTDSTVSFSWSSLCVYGRRVGILVTHGHGVWSLFPSIRVDPFSDRCPSKDFQSTVSFRRGSFDDTLLWDPHRKHETIGFVYW